METKADTKRTVAKQEATQGEKFTSMVIKEFSELTGKLGLTLYQKQLAQHLFIKIDLQLKTLENKRLDSGIQGTPITWQNINLSKLALDSMHRVELGLDALIPNHIHPIPYWNKRLNKYDLDLRIGYEGKKYYKQALASDKPIVVITELVYSNDKFRPIKGDHITRGDSYEFEIVNPFDRGEVVGGFGYLAYENSVKNELILVTPKDFERSKAKAKTKDFWIENPGEMRLKTVVHRTTDKIQVDPEKVNASYLAVEAEEDAIIEAEFNAEVDEKANRQLLENGLPPIDTKTKEGEKAPPAPDF